MTTLCLRLPLPALLACFALLAAAPALARADTVTLASGTVLEGRLEVAGERGLAVRLPSGELVRVPRTAVKELRARELGRPVYLRFSDYREDWSRLEALSRRFRSPDGARTVTLVGVLHIADLAYYREIQQHLDAHDLVLFEGVGAERGALSELELPGAEGRAQEMAQPFRPGGAEVSEVAGSDPLTLLQSAMASSLELTFQKDGVDYRRSWWIPADVSLEELGELVEGSEHSILSEMVSESNQRMQRVAQGILLGALGEAVKSVFTGKPLKVVLKETCAELLTNQLGAMSGGVDGADGEGGADADGGGAIADGPDSFVQEVLIHGRNEVVMARLREVLEGLPEVRSVAIFYGAGHNADLERRLVALGFEPVRDEWFGAWDIRSEARPLFGR